MLSETGKKKGSQCEEQPCNSASHVSFARIPYSNHHTRVLIAGCDADSSKAARVILRELISVSKKVIVIDADVSHPDFNFPAVLTAHKVRDWRFPPKKSTYPAPLHARFFGSFRSNRNPTLFASQLLSLVNEVRNSSWMSDLPVVMRLRFDNSATNSLVNVIRRFDPSSFVNTSNASVPDTILDHCNNILSNYHPDRRDANQLATFPVNEVAFSNYFEKEVRLGRVRDLKIDFAYVWSGDSHCFEMHRVEVGMLLVFCSDVSGPEPDVISHNWKGFGIVRAMDQIRKVAYVHSPLPQPVLTECRCFIATNLLPPNSVISLLNEDQPQLFLIPSGIPSGEAMKSRRNLARFFPHSQS